MTRLLGEVELTAQISHKCEDCRRVIEPGTRYARQTVKDGSKVYSYKSHTDCRAAALENWKNSGSFDDEVLPLCDFNGDKDFLAWLKENYPAVYERMTG